jgi:HEPN domain-containing protein
VNRDEEFKLRFADLATQYYVAARIAAKTGLAPIHGNLFHHAVELYLKAALVGTIPVEQMKRHPYSHDLRALWRAFKTRENDPALDRFDRTVEALNEFESIRYPDKIVDHGMIVGIAWKPDDVGPVTGTGKMPPSYGVVIEEVDHLIIDVLRRASVNPKFFSMRFTHPVAREALAYENPEAASWL